jgi:uncharacterized membrane protein YcaP (DUF421 family)
METLYELFGQGKDLNALQMCARAFFIFIITLLLIRISGRRSFAMKSPFDNAIVILLGALLSRTIVGASSFFPTIAAALVIVLMHRFFAWISLKSKWFANVTKGKRLTLYENNKLIHENMDKALVNEIDLNENIRSKTHSEGFSAIEKAYMEGSGEISIIKKDNK